MYYVKLNFYRLKSCAGCGLQKLVLLPMVRMQKNIHLKLYIPLLNTFFNTNAAKYALRLNECGEVKQSHVGHGTVMKTFTTGISSREEWVGNSIFGDECA